MNETVSSHAIAGIKEKPYFRVIKSIPDGISNQIEMAVIDFIDCSHVSESIDKRGFRNQTLQAIANASVLNGGGEFWIGTLKGELLIYTLGHISNDFDGRLSYNISQTWVRKDYRGNPIVKEWWKAIKQRAKDCLCGHLVITSSRNPKAYERWLGDGLEIYATLLKTTL